MKRLTTVVVALVLAVGLALAHGNEQHIIGKVKNISDSSITVETVKKETKTVEITSATKFTKSGSPTKVSDLKVGDKVVIHARKIDSKLQAELVQFGPSKRSFGSNATRTPHPEAHR